MALPLLLLTDADSSLGADGSAVVSSLRGSATIDRCIRRLFGGDERRGRYGLTAAPLQVAAALMHVIAPACQVPSLCVPVLAG